MSHPVVPVRFLFKAGCFYVWRSWRSTLVLSFMVFTGVAALVFLSALAVGTNDTMIRNSVGLFSGHISGEKLPIDYDLNKLDVKGVKYVVPRWQRQAWLINGEAKTPVILMGIIPEQEKKASVFWKKTIAGRFPEIGEAKVFLSEFEKKRINAVIGDILRVQFDTGPPAG